MSCCLKLGRFMRKENLDATDFQRLNALAVQVHEKLIDNDLCYQPPTHIYSQGDSL